MPKPRALEDRRGTGTSTATALHNIGTSKGQLHATEAHVPRIHAAALGGCLRCDCGCGCLQVCSDVVQDYQLLVLRQSVLLPGWAIPATTAPDRQACAPTHLPMQQGRIDGADGVQPRDDVRYCDAHLGAGAPVLPRDGQQASNGCHSNIVPEHTHTSRASK